MFLLTGIYDMPLVIIIINKFFFVRIQTHQKLYYISCIAKKYPIRSYLYMYMKTLSKREIWYNSKL